MNAKTERQITEMKNQTIGVEVEMNSIKRSKAAKIAADFFGTGRYENTASRNGYMTWSAWDADGREWKFQRDVSIHGADDEKWNGHADPHLQRHQPCRSFADAETGARATQAGDAGPSHQTNSHAADAPQPHQHHASHGSLIAEALKLDRYRGTILRTVGRTSCRRSMQETEDEGRFGHLAHTQTPLRQDQHYNGAATICIP